MIVQLQLLHGGNSSLGPLNIAGTPWAGTTIAFNIFAAGYDLGISAVDPKIIRAEQRSYETGEAGPRLHYRHPFMPCVRPLCLRHGLHAFAMTDKPSVHPTTNSIREFATARTFGVFRVFRKFLFGISLRLKPATLENSWLS